METKLEYMRRVCNELDVALTDVTTRALHLADELNLRVGEDAGPFEVIASLRQQVRIGEEYVKPYTPQRARDVVHWCEEHSTNYAGDRCNFGEHRRKL